MTKADLDQALQRQPFIPFRVWLKDGRLFEIRRRSHALLGPTVIIIGIMVPGSSDALPLYAEHIDLDLITRLEDLSPAAAGMF
jgi:hypothetical protein